MSLLNALNPDHIRKRSRAEYERSSGPPVLRPVLVRPLDGRSGLEAAMDESMMRSPAVEEPHPPLQATHFTSSPTPLHHAPQTVASQNDPPVANAGSASPIAMSSQGNTEQTHPVATLEIPDHTQQPAWRMPARMAEASQTTSAPSVSTLESWYEAFRGSMEPAATPQPAAQGQDAQHSATTLIQAAPTAPWAHWIPTQATSPPLPPTPLAISASQTTLPSVTTAPASTAAATAFARRSSQLARPLAPAAAPRRSSSIRIIPWKPQEKHSRRSPSPPPHSAMGISSESDSDEEAGQSDAGQTETKRKHGKDTRVITINHAIREQIYKSMQISEKGTLPNLAEDAAQRDETESDASAPVRFDWRKTIAQSPHNKRMRARVIAELCARRRHFKHVSSSEFADEKALQAVFDQAYTSLRLRWKAQASDAPAAIFLEDGEKPKVAKSKQGARQRRHARKTARLKERTETRKRLSAFAHATFDSALQMRCISSDESNSDAESYVSEGDADARTAAFVSHPPPWRSRRLGQLYKTLDEAATLTDKSSRTRARGAGRRSRVAGAPRQAPATSSHGVVLPPAGLPSWMISKRWRKDASGRLKNAGRLLGAILQDRKDDFDWQTFDLLGSESESEDAEACSQPAADAHVEVASSNTDIS